MADYSVEALLAFRSEEVYLELAELDLDDVEAIAGFAERYGLLGPLHPPGDSRDDRIVETLGAFRFWASRITNALTAWRVVQGSLTLKAARWSDWAGPENVHGAARFITDHVTPHLQAFAPSVLVGAVDASPAWSGVGNPAPLSGTGAPSLHNLMCLELYNHIAEEATYRQCANPTCRRTFVRQRGRAEKGQNRTEGVLYCSYDCAHAVSQRRHRARKRAQKEAAA